MIIIMKTSAAEQERQAVIDKIRELGLECHVSVGVERTIIGVVGDDRHIHKEKLRAMGGVEDVIPVLKPYKIVARDHHPDDTVIDVKGIPIGGRTVQVIAGPCSVETSEQMNTAARMVRESGCRLMRGGAYKPRTSPYSFQGHGERGLELLRESADTQKLPVVTELMDVRTLDKFLELGVEVIQIGTRNMQNFDLLKEVGRINVPVILKRGFASTISEWLMSAEYIAAGGNHNIIFCERGVRTFESAYRNMLDVTAIPFLKKETHLPVIVDPSHAGGKAWLVPALSKAAVAAGADGLLVEMHPTPCDAWCDADQALTPDELKTLMGELGAIARAIGREI